MYKTIYWTLIGCIFVSGDGTGSKEKRLDNAETPESCFEKVKTHEPTANGVTYGVHGQGRDKECYAEFGMTKMSASSQWQACIFKGEIIYITW